MYTRRFCLSLLLVAALTSAQDRSLAVQVTGDVNVQGRYRLVVPGDKPGARSVRMLKTLEVVQLRK